MSVGSSRQSLSPNAIVRLRNYMQAYLLIATPTKRRNLQDTIPKFIDVSDLNWEDILNTYSFDFDWDDFQRTNWDDLESRCKAQKNNYSADDYNRLRVAQLLKDIFIDHKNAELNFENLLQRIFEKDQFDIAKQVYEQIVKLTDCENQKTLFFQIYSRLKTNRIAENLKKSKLFGSTKLRSLFNRCQPINYKKVTLIGVAITLTFGLSFAAWKNYYQ